MVQLTSLSHFPRPAAACEGWAGLTGAQHTNVSSVPSHRGPFLCTVTPTTSWRDSPPLSVRTLQDFWVSVHITLRAVFSAGGCNVSEHRRGKIWLIIPAGFHMERLYIFYCFKLHPVPQNKSIFCGWAPCFDPVLSIMQQSINCQQFGHWLLSLSDFLKENYRAL